MYHVSFQPETSWHPQQMWSEHSAIKYAFTVTMSLKQTLEILHKMKLEPTFICVTCLKNLKLKLYT